MNEQYEKKYFSRNIISFRFIFTNIFNLYYMMHAKNLIVIFLPVRQGSNKKETKRFRNSSSSKVVLKLSH